MKGDQAYDTRRWPMLNCKLESNEREDTTSLHQCCDFYRKTRTEISNDSMTNLSSQNRCCRPLRGCKEQAVSSLSLTIYLQNECLQIEAEPDVVTARIVACSDRFRSRIVSTRNHVSSLLFWSLETLELKSHHSQSRSGKAIVCIAPKGPEDT